MTINVVCRRDAINRNRLAPLALVFTHDRRRKFVGLGISEALVHWDFDKQQPTADCPDRAEIQFQITSKIREYERKIKKLEVLEIPVTFDTLFEQNGKRINCTVGEYFKQIKWIENKLNNRPRKRLGYLTPNEKFKQIINQNSVAFAS